MISKYVQHKLYALAVLLLVIGGLNWGYLSFTGKDFITFALGKGAVTNAIFLAVGIAAISIAFYRDSYLPFLGASLVPCSVLQPLTPEGANTSVRVLVEPSAKVLFWASEPANKDLQTVQDWRHAYLNYRNAGVAVAGEDGYAELKVRHPQGYTVPFKGELTPHIHYRVCQGEGMMGRVMTVTLDGKEYFTAEEEEEGFENAEEEKEGFGNAEEEEAEGFYGKEDEEEEGFYGKEDEGFLGSIKEFFEPSKAVTVGKIDNVFSLRKDVKALEKQRKTEFKAHMQAMQKAVTEAAGVKEKFENAMVPGSANYAFPANNSIGELNAVAKYTEQHNLMPQSGALDEAPHIIGGYDLNAAFAAPAPIKYTAVNYS